LIKKASSIERYQSAIYEIFNNMDAHFNSSIYKNTEKFENK